MSAVIILKSRTRAQLWDKFQRQRSCGNMQDRFLEQNHVLLSLHWAESDAELMFLNPRNGAKLDSIQFLFFQFSSFSGFISTMGWIWVCIFIFPAWKRTKEQDTHETACCTNRVGQLSQKVAVIKKTRPGENPCSCPYTFFHWYVSMCLVLSFFRTFSKIQMLQLHKNWCHKRSFQLPVLFLAIP